MATNNSSDYSPTQYNTQVGGANGTLSNVAPSATSGIPLVSGGSSANPSFSTAVVAGGGTGVATMTTAYAPVCAGTTATGALQVASTGLSTSGYILTSTGSSSLPSFQAPAASSISVTGDTGGVLTGNAFTFTGGTSGLSFGGSGTTETVSGTLVVSNGGTGVATMTTAYAPVCAGTTATGALQVASTGLSTSGNVMVSNGASAVPSFVTPASIGASWVLLHTLTASNSASLAFTSTYITTTYQVYMVVFQGLLGASGNNEVTLNWSTDNGSTYINSNIASGINASVYNSATLNNTNATTKVIIGETVGTLLGLNGYALLYNLAGQGNSIPIMQSFTSQANQNVFGSAYMTSTTPNVNNIKLTYSSGNIASGTMSLYGLRQ